MSEIGREIKQLRVRGGLTQRQLAERSHVSHGCIGLLEKGQRRPTGDTLIAICKGLGLEEPTISELLQQAGHGEPGICAPLAKVRKTLNDALVNLPDHCWTFYVRDFYWPDELKLVDMQGVEREETMHGFVSPDSTKEVLQRGEDESFCDNAISATGRRDNSVRRPDSVKPELQYLFGDFVERERIKSSARLLIREGDCVDAVLFVNFRTATEFTAALKQDLRNLRDALREEIPAIKEALRLQDASILRQAMTILKPVQDWAAADIGQGGGTLKQYFESILDASMAAVGVSTSEGVGTIHLFDAQNDRLELAAYRGPIDEEKLKAANVQMVSKGEGIISWVALRRRAIVISDLADDNPFRYIHVPIREGERSEIAVPMLAGALVGVLNLESVKAGRFTSNHVRPLWYAANNAAVAARLYGQAIANRRFAGLNGELLGWCCSAIARRDVPGFEPIAELSDIARRSLGADRCDIWRFDPNRPEQFYGAGASYNGFECETPPRRGGWSDYVCRAKCAVWITIPAPYPPDVRSRFRFDVFFWDERAQSWSRQPFKRGTPDSVNERVIDLGVGSELGIPILSDNECLGVAWLKFDVVDRARLGVDDMLLARQFADGVGRVFKSVPLKVAPAEQTPIRPVNGALS